MDKQVNGTKHTTKVYWEENLGGILRMAQKNVIIGEIRNTRELEEEWAAMYGTSYVNQPLKPQKNKEKICYG